MINFSRIIFIKKFKSNFQQIKIKKALRKNHYQILSIIIKPSKIQRVIKCFTSRVLIR